MTKIERKPKISTINDDEGVIEDVNEDVFEDVNEDVDEDVNKDVDEDVNEDFNEDFDGDGNEDVKEASKDLVFFLKVKRYS